MLLITYRKTTAVHVDDDELERRQHYTPTPHAERLLWLSNFSPQLYEAGLCDAAVASLDRDLIGLAWLVGDPDTLPPPD